MKTITTMRKCLYIFLGGSLLFSTACEKEIDLNLTGNDNKYVVDAVLTDQRGGCLVKISQTKDFYADNSFAGVSGAKVMIYRNEDTTFLREEDPGIYIDTDLRGISGRSYGLMIVIGKDTITASSYLPTKVNFGALYVAREEMFGTLIKRAVVLYNDPANEANYYRFVQTINGIITRRIFVRNDDLTNGNPTETTLFTFANGDDDTAKDGKINSGDVITVEMQNVDAAVYKYFFSMGNGSMGDSNAAAPANPVSNLSGNAIGYFSAHTVQTKTITAP
jgi:hypothetical protein